MHSDGNRPCITYNVELITNLTMPFPFNANHITILTFEGERKVLH